MAVEDHDLGFRNIVSGLKELDNVEIVVGVLRNAGKEKDGTDLVDVAAYNEFGTKHIPSRPFIRIASDEHGDEWQDLSEQCVDAIIAGSMGRSQALNLIGSKAKADIQKVIGDKSKLRANSEKTVQRKGSSAPLIDTGRLRQSINYRIEE